MNEEIERLIAQITHDKQQVEQLQRAIDGNCQRLEELQAQEFAKQYGLSPGDYLAPIPELQQHLIKNKWAEPSIARFMNEPHLLFARGSSHWALICTPSYVNSTNLPVALAQQMRKVWLEINAR